MYGCQTGPNCPLGSQLPPFLSRISITLFASSGTRGSSALTPWCWCLSLQAAVLDIPWALALLGGGHLYAPVTATGAASQAHRLCLVNNKTDVLDSGCSPRHLPAVRLGDPGPRRRDITRRRSGRTLGEPPPPRILHSSVSSAAKSSRLVAATVGPVPPPCRQLSVPTTLPTDPHVRVTR